MYEIIDTLIETRINGNSIKGNKTYENMIKRIRRKDLKMYCNDHGYDEVYGTKLEIIEQLAKGY